MEAHPGVSGDAEARRSARTLASARPGSEHRGKVRNGMAQTCAGHRGLWVVSTNKLQGQMPVKWQIRRRRYTGVRPSASAAHRIASSDVGTLQTRTSKTFLPSARLAQQAVRYIAFRC